MPPLAALQEALQYEFRDPALLSAALRHASGSAVFRHHVSSNERLEFLGDRVLGLCIAERLCERFPADSVGELARRHARLVSREALDRVARAIHLGRYLELADSGRDAALRRNPAVLADACEAVIAALYLDGGLQVARAFIERAWEPLVAEALHAPKDAKTALQEWAQGRGFSLPLYEELGREGPDHQPRFHVRVTLSDGRSARASGASKRLAEAAAAAKLLAECEATDESGA
jgi:ribonuclease-3